MDKIYGQFDIETIEKLADIVSDKNLSEITIANGENSITVKGRKIQAVQAQAVQQVNAPAPSVSENKTADTISGNIVKSPIVGTFYAAPSPDKPAFVKVGDTVRKGDVIMIIESMKLMNEIQSDFDGVVDKILVSDGQAVEYDQPIMIIK